MTIKPTKRGTGKTVLIIVGIILIAFVKIFGPRLYRVYQMVEACPQYVSDPQKAVDGCAIIIKASAQKSQEKREELDIAHNVIWLHLAHVHANQNDEQEFQTNSQPYLTDKWPAPVLAFYLNKITMDDMLAKAQTGDPKDIGDQKCEAIYYAGEAYLQKGMKDEAIKNFRLASDSCPKDFVEKSNADAELAVLKP